MADIRVAALTRLLRERICTCWWVLFALYTYSVVVVCIDSSQPSGKQVIHLITTTTNHHLLLLLLLLLKRCEIFFFLLGNVHYIWKRWNKRRRTPYSRPFGMFQISFGKKKKVFRQQYAPHSSTTPSYGAELSSSFFLVLFIKSSDEMYGF